MNHSILKELKIRAALNKDVQDMIIGDTFMNSIYNGLYECDREGGMTEESFIVTALLQLLMSKNDLVKIFEGYIEKRSCPSPIVKYPLRGKHD